MCLYFHFVHGNTISYNISEKQVMKYHFICQYILGNLNPLGVCAMLRWSPTRTGGASPGTPVSPTLRTTQTECTYTQKYTSLPQSICICIMVGILAVVTNTLTKCCSEFNIELRKCTKVSAKCYSSYIPRHKLVHTNCFRNIVYMCTCSTIYSAF